mmetsp:Transcript_74341/g.227455  ORF Transcript_74341/g.227455 Transcript_74341/m.227455 type:complete len:209 (-) Transcript_74341:51-677(-)
MGEATPPPPCGRRAAGQAAGRSSFRAKHFPTGTSRPSWRPLCVMLSVTSPWARRRRSLAPVACGPAARGACACVSRCVTRLCTQWRTATRKDMSPWLECVPAHRAICAGSSVFFAFWGSGLILGPARLRVARVAWRLRLLAWPRWLACCPPGSSAIVSVATCITAANSVGFPRAIGPVPCGTKSQWASQRVQEARLDLDPSARARSRS